MKFKIRTEKQNEKVIEIITGIRNFGCFDHSVPKVLLSVFRSATDCLPVFVTQSEGQAVEILQSAMLPACK